MTEPTTPQLRALDLRCRDAEWIDRRATLDEFERPCPTRPGDNPSLVELLLTEAVARAHFGLDRLGNGQPIVPCELPRWGIPTGEWGAPLDDWRLRPELMGEIVALEPAGAGGGLSGRGSSDAVDRRGGGLLRQSLLVAAGSLPLLFTPAFVHAAPPSLPTDPAPAPTAADADPTATDPGTGAATDPGTPAPTSDPVVTAPPPRVDDGLSLTGVALWEGLIDTPVSLAMQNGQSLSGVLVAQSPSELAIARTSDGALVSVPKAEVAGVRLPASVVSTGPAAPEGVGPIRDRPTRDGRGLTGAGVTLVVAGSVLTVAGITMLSIYPSGLQISLPVLIPGLAALAGGGASLHLGKKRREAFRRAWGLPESARLQLTPTVGAGRTGGQAGLVLRF